MELGGDSACVDVQNQGHAACMKGAPSEVESQSGSLLPLVLNASGVLQCVVQDIDWASKGPPQFGFRHNCCLSEDLDRSSLQVSVGASLNASHANLSA